MEVFEKGIDIRIRIIGVAVKGVRVSMIGVRSAKAGLGVVEGSWRSRHAAMMLAIQSGAGTDIFYGMTIIISHDCNRYIGCRYPWLK